MKLIWPLRNPFTIQGYGGNFKVKGKWLYQRDGKKDMHRAYDIRDKVKSKTLGEDILCAYDGEVMEISGNYGIKVRHLIEGKYYWTVYWHALRVSVKVGQQVKMGQKLGTVGGDPRDYVPDGGYTSGPHCHWKLTEGEKYDKWASIDLDQRKDIEMLEYAKVFPDIPEWAEESWKRGVLNGYAPEDHNKEIDIVAFQELLVKADVIKQVGGLPAYRALTILDKLKGLIQ